MEWTTACSTEMRAIQRWNLLKVANDLCDCQLKWRMDESWESHQPVNHNSGLFRAAKIQNMGS